MKHRLSRQFFITYVLFFLCLVILSVPLYQSILSLLTRSYVNASSQLIQTGLERMESELESLAALVQDDFADPDIINVRFLTRPFSTGEYYRAIVATDEFRRSVPEIGIIADCGIVLGNDIIITPQRIHFAGEQFYADFFSVDGIGSFTQWKQEICGSLNLSKMTGQYGVVSYDNRRYDALFYVLRIPYSSSRQGSFFYATLNTDSLTDYFVTREMLDISVLRLTDMGGNLLFSRGQGSGDLVLIEQESAKLGLRLTVGIPRSFFLRKLHPLIMTALVFALVYVLSGLALSFVFAHRSARPIRSLVRTAASIGKNRLNVPPVQEQADRSEYQYLEQFLSEADSALEYYELALAQQKELLRANLFERLIRGLAYSASTFERARAYFPEFPDRFRIAAVRLSGAGTNELAADAARQSRMLSSVAPLVTAPAYIHFTGNNLVLLLPAERGQHGQQSVRALLGRVLDALPDDAKLSAALSDVFERMEDLHLAFVQASRILRYMGGSQAGRICCREDLPQIAPGTHSDPQDDARFYELVVRAEEEQACALVDRAHDRLRQSGYVQESDIQQVFFTFRRGLELARNELPEPLREKMALPSYDASHDYETLFRALKESVRAACECIREQLCCETEAFERSVLRFVDENLGDAGLYVKSVISHFGISESRLQAIFRKLTNKSFFEYVENQRMALAERLVCYTHHPITDIVAECGYTTLNSFYKAFRRNFGVSPSTMREKASRRL
ncbi:MAG: helix-turn-helix domain-containing protein [Christensenellales bacterium]|jgi:two-component system response regulator YesN